MKIGKPEHRPTQIAITALALEIVVEMGKGNADFDYAVKKAALEKIIRDYEEWQAAELARLTAEDEAAETRVSAWREAARDCVEMTLTRNQIAASREPVLPIVRDAQCEERARIHITTPEHLYPEALCDPAVVRELRLGPDDGTAGLGWFGFTAALFTLPEEPPPEESRDPLAGRAYIYIADVTAFNTAQYMSIEQDLSDSAPSICAKCERYYMRLNQIKPLAIA